MRRFILSSTFFLIASLCSFAQIQPDSLSGSDLNYASLMEYLDNSVIVSDSVDVAMQKQIDRNKSRNHNMMTYKLRIYFDNAQNARIISESIVDTFSYYYPDIPVSRTYVNPYFKVTVGDFKTKSDAMRFQEAIKSKYPTVFLVKEPFSTI